MAQQAKVLAVKSADLSSVPGMDPHVEGENQLPQGVLSPLLYMQIKNCKTIISMTCHAPILLCLIRRARQ